MTSEELFAIIERFISEQSVFFSKTLSEKRKNRNNIYGVTFSYTLHIIIYDMLKMSQFGLSTPFSTISM